MRLRLYKAYKAQIFGKTNKKFDFFNCSLSFFKRWIIHQLYGDMSIDNYGSVCCIDHCLPTASFNLLDEKEMRICFNRNNLRPMYTKENNSNRAKNDNRLYLMQKIKAYHF